MHLAHLARTLPSTRILSSDMSGTDTNDRGALQMRAPRWTARHEQDFSVDGGRRADAVSPWTRAWFQTIADCRDSALRNGNSVCLSAAALGHSARRRTPAASRAMRSGTSTTPGPSPR